MQALKNHLLLRLLSLDYDGDKWSFTSEQHNAIHFTNLYLVVESKLLHINYTTYDICWNYNTIQPFQGDVVMTSSRDQDYPFWYAWVICAWHIQAHFCPASASSSKHKMEVLWIHWLGINQDHRWDFKEGHLPKVGFVPDGANHAPFGFLDPLLMIYGCHLIPAFSDGHTSELLQEGASLVRVSGETDDWAGFYMNM